MDLTKDPIGKALLKFSLPIVLSFLLQSVYGIADLFVVGRFGGTNALAGVNMGSQIMDFVLGIATGLLGGGRVIIAQFTGRKRTGQVRKTIVTMFLVTMILSLILTVLMTALCEPVLKLMHTPVESYKEAKDYYLVCMTGILFIFGYNMVSSVLNGLGNSRTPLYFVIVSTTLNIMLDLLLVGRYGMGAFGAALATVISQAVSFFLGILYLRKSGILPEFNKRNLRVDRGILKSFLKIGIPSSYQNSILNISLVVVIAVANAISVYAAAAVGVCAKLNVIFILPIVAMNSAETVMVGQNMGAGRLDRVSKTCRIELAVTAAYALTIVILWWFKGDVLLRLFTGESRTIAMGTAYLKAHCFDYCLVMPAAYCLGGLFAGTGHTDVIAAANTAGAVLSRIPLCILLASYAGLGVSGIGLAFPVSTGITLLVYIIAFLKGIWKETALKEK